MSGLGTLVMNKIELDIDEITIEDGKFVVYASRRDVTCSVNTMDEVWVLGPDGIVAVHIPKGPGPGETYSTDRGTLSWRQPIAMEFETRVDDDGEPVT